MVVTHVSMDDPTVGISHRGTFPSPRRIRYLIEPDMPMTETVRGPPDHSLFSLTDNVREALPMPQIQGRKLQPSVVGQSYRSIGTFGDYDRRGLHIGVDDIRNHAGKRNASGTPAADAPWSTQQCSSTLRIRVVE